MQVAQIFVLPRTLDRDLRASELPAGGCFEILSRPLADEWLNTPCGGRVEVVCRALCVAPAVLQRACGVLSEPQARCEFASTKIDAVSWLRNLVRIQGGPDAPAVWRHGVPGGAVRRSADAQTFAATVFVAEGAQAVGALVRVAGLSARDAGLLKTNKKIAAAVESGRMPSLWVDLSYALRPAPRGSPTVVLALTATACIRNAERTAVLYRDHTIATVALAPGWRRLSVTFAGRFDKCEVHVDEQRLAVPVDVLVDFCHADMPSGFVPWVVAMSTRAVSTRAAQAPQPGSARWSPYDVADADADADALVLNTPASLPKVPSCVHELLARLAAYKGCHYDERFPWGALLCFARWPLPRRLRGVEPGDAKPACSSREDKGMALLSELYSFTEWDPEPGTLGAVALRD